MAAGFEEFGKVGGDFLAYANKDGSGVPWHSQGCPLPDGPVSAEKMIRAARLDWEVVCAPMTANFNGQALNVPDAYAVVRKDANKVLGTVGARYVPVQNRQVFSFFDNLVEEDRAIYETAGSLHGGKKIWVLSKLPNDIVLERNGLKDVTNQYILLATSHDGTLAVKAYFTPIRVVCQNTLTASLGNKSHTVSIRHSLAAEAKLRDAHKLMGFATEYYQRWAEFQNELCKKKFKSGRDMEKLEKYFNTLWPGDAEEGSRDCQKREQALDNFQEEMDRYGADWLSALNAATGCIDHGTMTRKAVQTADKRMDRLIMGPGAALKDRATKLALEMSGVLTN